MGKYKILWGFVKHLVYIYIYIYIYNRNFIFTVGGGDRFSPKAFWEEERSVSDKPFGDGLHFSTIKTFMIFSYFNFLKGLKLLKQILALHDLHKSRK